MLSNMEETRTLEVLENKMIIRVFLHSYFDNFPTNMRHKIKIK